jgi:hypothetical protein
MQSTRRLTFGISSVCLIYELLTGTHLFGVCLVGDDKEEDADEDDLLELNDVLGELPLNIMVLCPRPHGWFAPDEERLNPRSKKHHMRPVMGRTRSLEI